MEKEKVPVASVIPAEIRELLEANEKAWQKRMILLVAIMAILVIAF